MLLLYTDSRYTLRHIYHISCREWLTRVIELDYRKLNDIPISDPAANQYRIAKSQPRPEKRLL